MGDSRKAYYFSNFDRFTNALIKIAYVCSQRTFASTIMKKNIAIFVSLSFESLILFFTLCVKAVAFRLEVKVQGEFDLASVMIKCVFKSHQT